MEGLLVAIDGFQGKVDGVPPRGGIILAHVKNRTSSFDAQRTRPSRRDRDDCTMNPVRRARSGAVQAQRPHPRLPRIRRIHAISQTSLIAPGPTTLVQSVLLGPLPATRRGWSNWFSHCARRSDFHEEASVKTGATSVDDTEAG
jgi:hypothetical protein